MQKIETTGFIVMGICSIQTKYCVASETSAPLTVVKESPQGIQYNVCARCLQELIMTGEWNMPGAKILPDQRERILAGRKQRELAPA